MPRTRRRRVSIKAPIPNSHIATAQETMRSCASCSRQEVSDDDDIPETCGGILLFQDGKDISKK